MEETWRVPPEADGGRLDRHIAHHLDVPRNQVQRWIREDRVRLEGEPCRPSTAVTEGDRVECAVPEPQGDPRIEPEPGELAVLHEDPDLVVVNKPPGLTVHPGAGRPTGTLAHRLLARYPEMAGVGGPGRPGIVHRLDRGTSGVLVAARSQRAYRALTAAFAARQVTKSYLAVVYGVPASPTGRIDAPIGRHPRERQKMAVRPGGRPARTAYKLLGTAAGVALLEVDLGTGRTHQIRVHLKSEGHPLVGDPVYGEARWKGCPAPARRALREFPRPALHAWSLSFRHPADGRRVEFEAPVPRDLRELWEGATGTPLPEPAAARG